jgi:hypothetical protein
LCDGSKEDANWYDINLNDFGNHRSHGRRFISFAKELSLMSDSIHARGQNHGNNPESWSRFTPEEIHWAVAGWSKVAPGLGGWQVLALTEDTDLGRTVLVAPPTPLPDPLEGPRYVIAATRDGEAVIFADLPGTEMRRIGTFAGLSEALHHLCPLTPLQENEADALAAATPAQPST